MKTTKTTVTDVPLKSGKHTLYPGALGHRKWLLNRKNKTLTSGKPCLDSVVEICFAYSTDPLELQSFHGEKAKTAISKFGDALTNEEFEILQTHAETQLLKYQSTEVVPKKKPVRKRAKVIRQTRKR